MNIKDLPSDSYQVVHSSANTRTQSSQPSMFTKIPQQQQQPSMFTRTNTPDTSIKTGMNIKDLSVGSYKVLTTRPINGALPTPKIEKENNFVQDIINTPVTLVTNTLKVGSLLIAKLSGSKELQKTAEDFAFNKTSIPFLGTVAAQKAFGEGGGKQIAGQALEMAAWLYPPAKIGGTTFKLKTIYTKAMPDYFARGFAFGAADVLKKNGTTGEAIRNGAVSGFMSVAFGIVAQKVAFESTRQLRVKDSAFGKIQAKVKEDTIRRAEAGGKIQKNLFEIDRKIFFKDIKLTVMQTMKKYISPDKYDAYFGIVALVSGVNPLTVLAGSGLAIRHTYKFLSSTEAGRSLTGKFLLEAVLNPLSKLAPKMRSEVAPALISVAISTLVSEIAELFSKD